MTFFFVILLVPGAVAVVVTYLKVPEPPDVLILLIKMVLVCGIGFCGLLPLGWLEKEL